jgi:hypothetical protein
MILSKWKGSFCKATVDQHSGLSVRPIRRSGEANGYVWVFN